MDSMVQTKTLLKWVKIKLNHPTVIAAVITGICVLIAAVIAVLPSIRQPNKSISGNPFKNQNAGETSAVDASAVIHPPHQDKTFIRESTPSELISYLETLSDLHRETVFAAEYQGRWVTWEGTVDGLESSPFPQILVFVRQDNEWRPGRPLIALRFPSTARTELETLRNGDKISFEGRLVEISGRYLKIDYPRLLDVEKKR